MSHVIQVAIEAPGIARIMLNRPERRNALSVALLQQLCESVGNCCATPDCRVVVLGGNGPVFCAGLDLQEATDESMTEQSAMWIERALAVLRDDRIITIAAVQGGAYAGGAGLMSACDFVIAADNARFGFPEARRGLVPALILHALRWKVREGDLRDLLLTGEPINAVRARDMGLVQRLTDHDSVIAEAVRAARAVIAGGPETIRRTKQMLNSAFADTARADHNAAADIHRLARRHPEAREGLQAFLENRRPEWDFRD